MKWLRIRSCWMIGAALVVAIGCATTTPVVKGDQADANINGAVTIPARDAWLISIAIQARMADASLSASERDWRNFDARLTDLGDEVEVRFIARRAPGEEEALGGRTSLGRHFAYVIRKSDGKVVESHGFK